MKELSIVVPIYNEEKSINSLFSNLRKISIQLNSAVEFILVNDGSNDKSKEILDKWYQRISSSF